MKLRCYPERGLQSESKDPSINFTVPLAFAKRGPRSNDHNRNYGLFGYTLRMLSEKQFRERAAVELREIGKQVAGLAADRDLYRKLEGQVIAQNPLLQDSRSAFLGMVRAAYTDAMALRVLHLLDSESPGLSLRRVLAQLGDYPEVRHDKVGDREFSDDVVALERAADELKAVMEPRFSPHERSASALASTQRAIDEALDAMISTLKTYYWVVAAGHLDLEPVYGEDPLAIFRFAWMEKS